VAVYRVGPVQRWETIGTFGRIAKVAEARKLASEYIQRAKLGIHAAPERRDTREVEARPGKGDVATQQRKGLPLVVVVEEFLAMRRGIRPDVR
jgi:hypothetical protein